MPTNLKCQLGTWQFWNLKWNFPKGRSEINNKHICRIPVRGKEFARLGLFWVDLSPFWVINWTNMTYDRCRRCSRVRFHSALLWWLLKGWRVRKGRSEYWPEQFAIATCAWISTAHIFSASLNNIWSPHYKRTWPLSYLPETFLWALWQQDFLRLTIMSIYKLCYYAWQQNRPKVIKTSSYSLWCVLAPQIGPGSQLDRSK